MIDPQTLEASYQEYISDLPKFLPDGIFEVDLALLSELGLLENQENEEDDSLGQSFYVIESDEKLTLFNQKYIVWIVPQVLDQNPATFTLIALNVANQPQLEMVFATKGVYNHSALVLRILEKFLEQIEENESAIEKYDGDEPQK